MGTFVHGEFYEGVAYLNPPWSRMFPSSVGWEKVQNSNLAIGFVCLYPIPTSKLK